MTKLNTLLFTRRSSTKLNTLLLLYHYYVCRTCFISISRRAHPTTSFEWQTKEKANHTGKSTMNLAILQSSISILKKMVLKCWFVELAICISNNFFHFLRQLNFDGWTKAKNCRSSTSSKTDNVGKVKYKFSVASSYNQLD